MKVRVGMRSIEHEVSGETFVGRNEVLVRKHDDLTSKRVWGKEGFTLKKFLPIGTFLQFHQGVEELFRKCMQKAGIDVDAKFNIANYHKLVKNNPELHERVVEQTKLLQWYHLPIHISIIEEAISEIVSIPVKTLNPLTGERTFQISVVRPGQPDHQPLHRDAWQENNNDTLNIYVPIAGSNKKSSLVIAPGSHFWPEHRLTRTKNGAEMNGIKFDLPGLIESELPLTLQRPNPGMNHVLVFSPYLIHGGSANQNKNTTRISLEMRFWRKNAKK